MSATPDLSIDELLAELGFETAEARALARAAIEADGLTNSRKQRIAAAKRGAVVETLRRDFVVVCARPGCRDEGTRSRRTVVNAARASTCEVCGGSANRTEVDRVVAELQRRGLSKLVVVGGSPNAHIDLRGLIRGRVELRLVSGTERRTAADAKADLGWADVIVVWGGTQLDHKVSKFYTDARQANVVTCSRRGIAALALTVTEHLARGTGRH